MEAGLYAKNVITHEEKQFIRTLAGNYNLAVS